MPSLAAMVPSPSPRWRLPPALPHAPGSVKSCPGPTAASFSRMAVCVCVCVCVRARGYYAPCATCLACKTARRTRRVCEHCVFRHEVKRAPNVRSGAGRGGGTFALIASRLALGFAAPFRLRTLARACLACKPARSTRRVTCTGKATSLRAVRATEGQIHLCPSCRPPPCRRPLAGPAGQGGRAPRRRQQGRRTRRSLQAPCGFRSASTPSCTSCL